MSPRDTHQLGDLIRRTREAHGLSQAELARLSGVGRTTIIRIEQAEIESPDPHKLQLLARHLDLGVEDLFAFADYATPGGLPAFGPYLRARYGDDLSDEARARLEEYFEMVQEKFGEEQRGDGAS